MVEIIGTIILLLASGNFILPMIGLSAYVDVTYSFPGIILGLVLIGKRAIAETLRKIFGK